jgi:hypothetical protein
MEWSFRSLQVHTEAATTLLNDACLQARTSEREGALEVLAHVATSGWGQRDWIEREPGFDIPRVDPRRQATIERPG